MTTTATIAMKAAWTNARRAAAKFNDSPIRFFAICLKQAWAWAKKEAAKRFNRNELVGLAAAARETAKAIGINVTLVCPHTDQSVRRLAWFPKSMLTGNAAPRWLVKARADELRNESSYQGRTSLIVEDMLADGSPVY